MNKCVLTYINQNGKKPEQTIATSNKRDYF